MAVRKRHWLWNMLIVVAVIACVLAFVIHYKNWIDLREDRMKILSGIYYREIVFDQIDSVQLVDRLPSMERKNGFSAWAVEKGVFIDSLRPSNEIYVFVDNLKDQKIRIVYRDSLLVFLNLRDSSATMVMFKYLEEKKDMNNEQFLDEN